MKYTTLIAVLAFGLTACQKSDDAPSPQTAPEATTPEPMESVTMQEPRADKRPHEMTLHGISRTDDYFWLRDDERSDPDVIAYLEAENGFFDEAMAHTEEMQSTLYDEMVARLDPDESSVPYDKDGWWYYYRYEPDKDYAIYARRKGSMEADEEILVDGNQRAEGHDYYSLANLEMSDDHRYAAMAEDTLSRRIHEIRILDTQTGEFLPEVIGNANASIAWSADGDYLFYLDKDPETLLAYRVMRHKLGTDPAEDELVYEEKDNRFYTGLGRSRSGDFIMLVHRETETSEVKLLPADQPLGEFRIFLPREAGHEYSIDHANGRFFIRSNWDAENFRVLSTTDLATSADKSTWKEVIPHREDAMVREIQAFDEWLVVGERKDGLRQVRVIALDGSLDRYLDADSESYVMWPGTNVNTDTSTVRYGYSSLTTPTQTWEVDLQTGETTLLKAQRVLGGFDSADYSSKRMMITARDGTEVPVSLAYHKNTALDGSAPALVYAYGSYGSSTDPWFRNSVVSLLDRGFVYAIAHIRGGQEMGRQWYEQGRLMNKKNTFTDFVDATRALQEQGLIDPERTFAMGGSAGGLLMGAVVNMAPELYHGVIAAVPFVDVVTTMLDESIPLTSNEWNEWGDPREKEAFEYMLSYSPYDNVSEQDYPNLMVTTGLHDSQVQYFEPAKWVAKLREKRTDDNRLIMKTNMEAGHGGASGRYRAYEEVAEEYAFLVDLAGMEK
ncbi:MAG: S9 family peptidase [Xanthomonadales bacterium]|nr:S9 family peptidase [Gammaproteobacteria bacterium]NNJ79182.1 S9 family peptidase [Xanthomonadales bacterium]NNL04538.1 S9 family peptidase [Xanthomonadales bacterium]